MAALALPLLASCTTNLTSSAAVQKSPPVGGATLRTRLTSAPQIINVSEYDPKERQRSGDAFSPTNLSALRRNGALGLIARCGKGRTIDAKCGTFLAAAEREGMLIGSYFFVLDGIDPVWQADRFVDRIRAHKSAHGLKSDILLVGDFDSKSSPTDIIRFIDRIERRTGKLPMIYLENSVRLQSTLRSASPAQKQRIAQCPYWLALYSPDMPGIETPERLLRSYGIWNKWVMWQYGGVNWDARRSRSVPKYYNHGPWRAPAYFGSLDRPTERNAFNGSSSDLARFWATQACSL